MLSWNDRRFYMRQTFRSLSDRNRPVATGHLTVIFRSPKGTVPPAAVVRLAVQEDIIPPLLDNATRAKFGMSALPTTLAPLSAS